jgi:bifunctional DNase/RNase
MTEPVPMDLVGVKIELPTNTPILLLKETAGTRYLPIWIGPYEATAIARAIEGEELQRPLTHDLLKLVTESLGATVERVVVTSLEDGTFFADLVMTRDGEQVTVSSRPSDAIALAARAKAPVFAAIEVIEEAGVEIQLDGEEEEIERFREFLDEVVPEDFEGHIQ